MKKETIFTKYEQNYDSMRAFNEEVTTDFAKVAMTAARRLELAHSKANSKADIKKQFDMIVKRATNMGHRHDAAYNKRLGDLITLARQAFGFVRNGDHDAVYRCYKEFIKMAKNDQRRIANGSSK